MKEVKQKKSKAQKSVPDKIFVVLNTLFMIAFVVITLYPVLNTLAISLNDGTDALRGGIYLLPRKFTMKNYVTVLQKNNLLTGAYITVLSIMAALAIVSGVMGSSRTPGVSEADSLGGLTALIPATGGACFVVSDILLGINRLGKKRSSVRGAFVLILYYAAVYLFAMRIWLL